MRERRTAARARPRDDLPALTDEFREWNRRQTQPRRECPTCGFPTLEGDWGAILTDRCCVCDARWLDGVIERIARRLGRERLIEALIKLADAE